jgi:hypothetical protein
MGDSQDVVEPADRKIHGILVHIAETTTDDAQRQIARDLLFTLPPMREWSEDSLRDMYELMAFVEIRKNFH